MGNETSKFMQKLIMTLIHLSLDEETETTLKFILRKYILSLENFRMIFDKKDGINDLNKQLNNFKKIFLSAFDEISQKFL